MRLNEIEFGAQPPIDGYGPGGFRIAGEWHEGSLVLLASGIHKIEAVNEAALAPLIASAGEVDVVLVGQGMEIAAPDATIRAAIEAAGPGVEFMSTPSACRTYNVLLAEDRRVAAVIQAV
ncbi:Mth938-like domain-containing protein [Rhodobacteraceae bacterium NNCM2]|nr:Mth938-like domain-containing protein [Coraliihabitans acroporae]